MIVILQGSYTLIVHFANKYDYILYIVLAWQFQQKMSNNWLTCSFLISSMLEFLILKFFTI
jgi:hypothetical protein